MYKVIVEKKLEKLEKNVSRLIAVGWKLAGGIVISTARSTRDVEYFQAVYKSKAKPHEDKEESKAKPYEDKEENKPRDASKVFNNFIKNK